MAARIQLPLPESGQLEPSGKKPLPSRALPPGVSSLLLSFANQISLQSINPEQNRYRFYVIARQVDLWNNSVIVCRWGRIGGPGRLQVRLYPDRHQAHAAVQRLLEHRLRRGYRVVAWE